MMLEALEQRRLLAGVTLIAHGATGDTQRQAWVDQMAAAIESRAAAPIFLMRITEAPGAPAWQMQRLGGSGNVSDTGNAIVVLDWADVSHTDVNYHTTTEIAGYAANALTQTFPDLGITAPLAELPIHLIGHSRGGSLVPELARRLGEAGLQVDQQTTLDAHPVNGDAGPRVYQNTVFADNYFETNDALPGSSVAGARNVDLTALDRIDHMEVPEWYLGTVPASPSSWDTDPWYSGSTGPRGSIGYAWTLQGGALRPDAGSSLAGAERAGVDVYASGSERWDNVLVSRSAPSRSGNNVVFSYRVDDANTDATVRFGIDRDDNPYNGVQWIISHSTGGMSPSAWQTATLSTLGLEAGTYRICVAIHNAAHSRYDYSPAFEVAATTVNHPPQLTGVGGTVKATLGQQLSRSGTVSDADGHPIELSVNRGLISRSGANWTWTYSADQLLSGENVTITASDSYGGVTSASFNLTVSEVPRTPMSIRGGSGKDTVSLSLAGDELVAKVNGKTQRRALASVSNIVISTLGGDDTVTVASQVQLACSILGGAGNDRLSGGSGNDTIRGGDGNDTIRGGNGNDSLSGEQGNDWVFGGSGNDTLYGGGGNDRIGGENGDDLVFARNGDRDTIGGGAGRDRASLDRGRDVFSRSNLEQLL